MMRRIGGNMRSLIVLFSLVASTALAQYDNGGVWTGYVGGWKPNTQQQVIPPGSVLRPNPMLDWPRPRQPQRVVVMPYYVPANTTSVNQETQRAAEQAEQRRAWEAEQARIAQQNQLENERRLAAEREAMLQQQLESERRLAAEREALAAEKLRLERETAARTLAAMTPPPVQPEPVRPATPQTPGNDIYRWVDADGVTHYSTNVPAAAKASATKVGGSR